MQPTISFKVGIVCLLLPCLLPLSECRNRRRILAQNLPIGRKPIKYSYSFDVADDNVALYQSQSQTRDNKVVTGQYSWVDSIGVRRITRYRADDTGYHILEMREEHPTKPKGLSKGRIRMKAAFRNRKLRKRKLRRLQPNASQALRKPRVLRVVRKKKKNPNVIFSLPPNDIRPAARPLPIRVLPLSFLQPDEQPLFLSSAPSLSII